MTAAAIAQSTVAALPVLIDTLREHGYTIRAGFGADGQDDRRGDAAADVLAVCARAFPIRIAFSALAMIGNFIVIVFFRGRRPDERAADSGGYSADHRPPAPAAPRGFAGIQSPRRRADSGLQRREGDRAHHSLGAELRL